MFKLLALVLLAYAATVARKGRVTIRDGGVSRIVHRDEALVWFHCAVYAALALALATLP
jgi:hypothetical protein